MISFIIPTLNEGKYIDKTLSYLSEYKKEHEIIVSDTNSKDETVSISKKYTDKVIVHSKEGKKLTIGAGRNLGASHASGEFLVFLDADICIVKPNEFFEKALKLFENNPKLVGLTVRLHVFKELETFGDKIVIPFFIYARLIMNNIFGIGAATGEFQMIRMETFKKLGGFDESLATGEDDDMFRRLSKVGKTRLENSLVAYHSGRRAHALGWPKLLYIWTKNTLSIWFLGKAINKEWEEVR